MNHSFLNFSPPLIQFKNFFRLHKIRILFYPLIITILFILSSCAPAKFSGVEKDKTSEKTPSKEKTEDRYDASAASYTESVPVRILIGEGTNTISFTVNSPVNVFSGLKPVAVVKSGNKIELAFSGAGVSLVISGQEFTSGEFRFSSFPAGNIFEFNGKKYRGSIIVNSKNKIINIVSLEDYLKGVLPAEMPAGKGTENFEALKAQAICARTYTMMKLNEKKTDFDMYVDVRDQVYGGADSEREITNEAVEATRGKILCYDSAPATVFYSASCGGYTEDGANVFVSAKDSPYLISVKDGDEPYCSITPKFQWEEIYTQQGFSDRFAAKGLITSGSYSVKSAEIKSRFNSGRVNELEIIFSDGSSEIPVTVFGNQIRSIIRTSDNKGILRSTMFDISVDGDNVIIRGKGNGHGVGLCQWGAISMSRSGFKFDDILKHYFPGTDILLINK